MRRITSLFIVYIIGANAQQLYQYPQQYYYNQQYYPQQYYPQQYYQQQQQQFASQPQPQPQPQPQQEIEPKKLSPPAETSFDLPPPPPSRFAQTKTVQPISRTRLVQRPSPSQSRAVASNTVNRGPQRPVATRRPAPAPTPPRRTVPSPAPVSHLSPTKRDPNSFFLSCCKNKRVAKTCESRCNFDVLTKKVLTGMFLGSDPCPQANGLDLFSCAAQDGDHTPCCRRNKVHTTGAGDKCLNFCRMTPDHSFQADASYLPCWAVLNKIKACFKDAIVNGARH